MKKNIQINKLAAFVLICLLSMLICGCLSKSKFGSKSAKKLQNQFRSYLRNEERKCPQMKSEWMAFKSDVEENSGELSKGFDKYQSNQKSALSNFKKEYNSYINNE